MTPVPSSFRFSSAICLIFLWLVVLQPGCEPRPQDEVPPPSPRTSLPPSSPLPAPPPLPEPPPLLPESVPSAPPDGLLHLDFLDVGQGDGVVIRTPSGKVALVDGGKPDGQADDQLTAMGIRRLDLLLASHADYDHSGSHRDLLRRFPVREYVWNGLPHGSESFSRLTSLLLGLEKRGAVRVRTSAKASPGSLLLEDGARISLLPPPRDPSLSPDANLHSLGVLVTWKGFKALMTGDSEKPETRAWLADPKVPPLIEGTDVYKAIHHGSRDGDAGNTPWLKRVDPQVVVIQVGANDYGHPTSDALRTYSQVASQVFRTDRHGRVSVTVDRKGGYHVTTERDGKARAPQASKPSSSRDCPTSRPVKGNDGERGRIYHLPGESSYTKTRPEVCFASAAEAQKAGYRPTHSRNSP